jgi:hypothetical protein
MDSLRSAPLMLVLILAAIVFAIAGVLYAMGAINILTTHPNADHHYSHAALMAVLALASLVGASLVRPKPA